MLRHPIIAFQSRLPSSLPVSLSQEDFLHPARRHAGFVLRVRLALGSGALGGRAAGRGALRGAQVVHQRDAVLATEVNKLDLPDAAVKVDTWKGRGHSNDTSEGGRRNI